MPEIATRYHVEVINYCFKDALKKAGIRSGDIDLISVTQGPGLIGALLIGIAFAKGLSFSLGVPIVGTNHVIAHLWANFLDSCGNDKPAFPFIGLVVSGGHSCLVLVRGPNRYSVLGQTQDDAVGEAFDKVAKLLNLGYPGGPAIEKSAERKAQSAKHIKFSLPSAKDDSFDFSFSGVKTAVLYYVKAQGGAEKLTKEGISEIAYSFQEAVCGALVAKGMSACKVKGIKSLVVGGGVSANLRLRKKLAAAAGMGDIKVFIPPLELCLDNAAMTAVLGYELFKKGARSDLCMSGFANMSS